MASSTNKILRDSTLESLVTANQSIRTSLNNLLTQLVARDGSLSSLSTTAKSNLVAAINEVKTATTTNASAIAAIDQGGIFDLLDELSTADTGSGIHNSIFRGKNLGTAPTEAQLARIAD